LAKIVNLPFFLSFLPFFFKKCLGKNPVFMRVSGLFSQKDKNFIKIFIFLKKNSILKIFCKIFCLFVLEQFFDNFLKREVVPLNVTNF